MREPFLLLIMGLVCTTSPFLAPVRLIISLAVGAISKRENRKYLKPDGEYMTYDEWVEKNKVTV